MHLNLNSSLDGFVIVDLTTISDSHLWFTCSLKDAAIQLLKYSTSN